MRQFTQSVEWEKLTSLLAVFTWTTVKELCVVECVNTKLFERIWIENDFDDDLSSMVKYNLRQ